MDVLLKIMNLGIIVKYVIRFGNQIQNDVELVHDSRKIYHASGKTVESYKKLQNNNLNEIRDLVESKLNEEKKNQNNSERLHNEEISVYMHMLYILTKEIDHIRYTELSSQIVIT